MSEMVFDVLIVGAGPAGSLAAEYLSGKGANVCLFDGREEDNPKACGGGVTTKSFTYYPHLMHAAARIINKVDLHAPNGSSVQVNLDDPFAIFSRAELDSFLCKRARDSGATVIQSRVKLEVAANDIGQTWKLRAIDGSIWRGKTLVAADGANSPLAKRLVGALKIEEMEVAFGYRVPFSREGSLPTTVAFLPGLAGYAWAFPRLDHISFGIATSQNNFNHKALDNLLWIFMVNYYRALDVRAAESWNQWHTRFEFDEDDKLLAKRIKQTAKPYAARIPGVSAQTWESRRVVGKNWALLGDAAGFADSVTGEGIFYALRSGDLFAKAYLRGDIESYEDAWRADFGVELIRAAKLRNRFYGSFIGGQFTERMIQLARHHRGVKQTLGGLIAGEQSYTNLKRTLLARALSV